MRGLCKAAVEPVRRWLGVRPHLLDAALSRERPLLAHSGVQLDTSLSIVDAVLVTQDHLAALGDP